MSVIRSPTITVQTATDGNGPPPGEGRVAPVLNMMYRFAVKNNRTNLKTRIENFAAKYNIKLEPVVD